MAGESPDRSKQRESSADGTSGSAGSVPESRNEAGDPRLALTGESGEPGASDGSEQRGGVDTATRVLSVRDVKPEAKPGTKRESEPEKVTDEGGAADDGDEADATGDGRLRAAVAAWVNSGSDGKRPEAETEGASGEGEGEGEGEAAGAKPGASGSPEADGAEDASDGEAAARGKDGSESRAADETAQDAEGADDAQRGRTGVAPEADAEGHDDAERGKDGDRSRAADETAQDASDAEDVDATDADADAEGAKAGTASEDATRSKDGTEPKADAEDADDDGDGKRGEADEPTEDAESAGDDGDGKRGGDGKPVGAGEAGEDSDEADEAAEDAPEAGDGGSEGSGSGTGEKPPVDQPTTMLKLGGAAKKPQVDQPTTMLKLGGDKKRAPESDAERTSKFVALKRPDAVQTRKPQPAQPATPAPKPVPADGTAATPQAGPERTTQQPLPPRPPLDLLAELTNTPPPPETPLRTTVRRVKIWTPLVVLLLIVFAVVQAVRPLPEPTFALTAEDTYTFEGNPVKLPWPSEGQGWMDVDGVGTMDHFGEQKPVAIGSVAKTMTAYIILRDHPLKVGEEGPKIEIDPTAEKEGGFDKAGESTLNTMKAGEFLTEKQALSAVMIPSANNIARLLARWDAGSEAEFVKKMNATAKELGMANTTYTDPSGLKETTVSTAEDQVKLGNAAMTIPAMVAITSAASWTDPTGKYWNNYNELPYAIGAIGIKTGSTTAAGGNLLFAAHKQVGGRTVTIVGAILGQHQGQSILDTVNAVSKTALLAAKDVPTSAKILKKGDVVGYVDDQLGGHTPVVVTKDVTAVGWAGLRLKLSLTTKDVLPHTAKAGTDVGMLTVGDGADGAVQVPVALQEDLAEPGFPAKLTRIG
ncbi:D-alanyl-D-alanine carboxypeptidase [Streptomyces cyslabdanicus]|uniref:D-alanyl-D-alanine carboxypeptidase n=1 Tax=Streptomyces cyslabdanicus TaxID=1470456 RepID=UPI004043E434